MASSSPSIPPIACKVERRGQNAIRTQIDNLWTIAQILHRPPAYIMQFFRYELGVIVVCRHEQNRFLVNGEQDPMTMQRLLERFIHFYVMCPQCTYRETVLLHRPNLISILCLSCHEESPLDSHVPHVDRLTSYILSHPPIGTQGETRTIRNGKK